MAIRQLTRGGFPELSKPAQAIGIDTATSVGTRRIESVEPIGWPSRSTRNSAAVEINDTIKTQTSAQGTPHGNVTKAISISKNDQIPTASDCLEVR